MHDFTGTVESVAFDQTVDALQVALIAMIRSGCTEPVASIARVVLAQRRHPRTNYIARTAHLVGSIAPGAAFDVVVVP